MSVPSSKDKILMPNLENCDKVISKQNLSLPSVFDLIKLAFGNSS